MKSTRERILERLLSNPFSSITDLAEAVGINAISVRHHLTSLQADGLVTAQEERHGVGRPKLVYLLTNDGRERFPTRYLELTNLLIDHIKEKFPKESLENIFTQIAEDLTKEEIQSLRGLPVEEKLSHLQKFMQEEGYGIEWEKQGNSYVVTQSSCPYFHVTQQHPEVCALTRTIMSQFLSLESEKIDCISKENGHCSFYVSSDSLKDAA